MHVMNNYRHRGIYLTEGSDKMTYYNTVINNMQNICIIIIVYHIRRRRLLCAQNFVQTSLFFAKFIRSNGDLPTIVLRQVRKVSRCRPLSRLPSTNPVTTRFSSSPFRRISPRKVSCL